MIFPTTFFYIPRAEATPDNRLFSKEPQTFKPPVFTSMLSPCCCLSLECSSLILYPLITYQSEMKSSAITSVSIFLTCQIEGTAFFLSPQLAVTIWHLLLSALYGNISVFWVFFECLSLLFVIFLRAEHIAPNLSSQTWHTSWYVEYT